MYGINLYKVIIPKITLSKYILKEISSSSKTNNVSYKYLLLEDETILLLEQDNNYLTLE